MQRNIKSLSYSIWAKEEYVKNTAGLQIKPVKFFFGLCAKNSCDKPIFRYVFFSLSKYCSLTLFPETSKK